MQRSQPTRTGPPRPQVAAQSPRLYFDHNAASSLLPVAAQAWLEAAEQFPGNPSSPHRVGARAEAALQAARQQLAELLDCHALDIVWTSGATEANNLVVHHLAQTLPARAEVWVSALEHPCVLAPVHHYFPKRHRLIPVDSSGTIDLDWLQRRLARQPPGAVGVMAANNETGVLQPWREVLALCRQHGVPCFCDAVQWIGKLPAHGLGQCDFVSGSAHKFGGPKGVGFLKCPSRGPVKPLLLGGPQEDGRRAGTENVAGVRSMMAAVQARATMLAAGRHTERAAWRQNFERGLVRGLPGAVIVGAARERLWNTVSALMPPSEGPQRWVVKLDRAGCAVSTGSACASGREEPSHVLAAMGYGPAEASRVLRFSSGWETTEADWQALEQALVQVNTAMRTPA
jgi:cysteine desulfurase